MKPAEINEINSIIVAIVVIELIGNVGTYLAIPAFGSTWYAALQKPAFAPSPWVLVEVWLVLYALMGIAAHIVWERAIPHQNVRNSMIMFSVQLSLSVFWFVLFFAFHAIAYSLIEIAFLLVAVWLTAQRFSKISKFAAVLMVPAVVWVAFLMFFNVFIWKLN